jgi:hypothetical protein
MDTIQQSLTYKNISIINKQINLDKFSKNIKPSIIFTMDIIISLKIIYSILKNPFINLQ